MGCGGSQGGGANLALPQQQIVSAGGNMQQSAPTRPPVRPLEQTDASTQMKISFVWDKASLSLQRVGDGRDAKWQLSANFSAEEPCAFAGTFNCVERFTSGVVELAPAEGGGPPCIGASFAAGSHRIVVPVDLQTYPLELYWKEKRDGSSVQPIVLELRSAGGGSGRCAQQSLIYVAMKRDSSAAGGHIPAVLKHKVVVEGKEHTLQEVYGLAEIGKESSHDESAMGEPCVICLTESRNTAVLPCMHLCVCEDCGGQLLAQASIQGMNCPICRGGIGNIRVFNVGKS